MAWATYYMRSDGWRTPRRSTHAPSLFTYVRDDSQPSIVLSLLSALHAACIAACTPPCTYLLSQRPLMSPPCPGAHWGQRLVCLCPGQPGLRPGGSGGSGRGRGAVRYTAPTPTPNLPHAVPATVALLPCLHFTCPLHGLHPFCCRFQRAIAALTERFGEDHQDTAAALSNLACLYQVLTIH